MELLTDVIYTVFGCGAFRALPNPQKPYSRIWKKVIFVIDIYAHGFYYVNNKNFKCKTF